MARQLAQRMDCEVNVWDERPHVAGNCHTERDSSTGVMVHKYGPHIFNTDREDVWDYVRNFARFRPFTNRVKAVTPRGVFSLPINLLTLNQFFGKQFGPQEARTFVASLGDASIGEPSNFEEQALKFLGRELYENFFHGYTCKQWGCEPRELPASVLKRLPVRFNYDDNYYLSRFQGIPEEGYTAMVQKMLEHPAISVELNKRFEPEHPNTFAHVIYTGPLDAFFGFRFGRLGYRTVTFERLEADGDFQGNAVVNYTDPKVHYTRIHEHKHFAPWEEHARTVYFREYSKETEAQDPPFYPKRLAGDCQLLTEYRKLASQQMKVSFLGRLATYRYMDMDEVIGEALDFAESFVASHGSAPIPVFPNQEP